MDARTLGLVGGVLLPLGAATVVVQFLKRRADLGLNTAVVEAFRLRLRAWWLITALVGMAFLVPQWLVIATFGLVSFWALREFITLTPTRPADHRALFWVFLVFTPAQYVLVGLGRVYLYSILIPVYAFLFIPARIALEGDYKRFLERAAKIQVGLLICVYCFSHAPALMTLDVSAFDKSTYANARLLFFFVVVVQCSDAFQYAWSRLPVRHVMVPSINSTRTWEGLIGGTASVTLLGAALWWAIPLGDISQAPALAAARAAAMAAVIAVMGCAGGLTMSAIKRDRGVQDFGTLVEGHGGVLDRIDSICFAAPVFFHLTRIWLLFLTPTSAGM